MKAFRNSQREYERKIHNLEQKIALLCQKSKSKSERIKYLNRRVRELRQSRDKWKSKNADKALRVKSLKKCIKNREKIRRHHYCWPIIALCIKLRVQAGCSYRGIRKIRLILRTSFALDLKQLPGANSIENWVSKMGCYCIAHAEEDLNSKEVCLIVDESFRQGNERLLLLLITNWQKEKQEALSYNDVRVCYLGGKKGWNGEQISQEIKKIVTQKGTAVQWVESYIGRPGKFIFKLAAQTQPQGAISYDRTDIFMERFLAHLRTYIDQYERFLSTHTGTFNVSSDIIESMFGKHKSISGTNTLVGVSQLDLEIPVHNIEPKAIDPVAKLALESILMSDLKTWRNLHCADKQADKKRKFFKNQNPVS